MLPRRPVSLVLLAFALSLAAGCAEGGPGGSPPGGGEGLPPPEPGALEHLRAAVDPPVHPDSGEVLSGEGEAGELPEPSEGDPVEAGSEEAPPAPGAGEGGEGEVGISRPEHVRGIYLNAWTAGSVRRREPLLDLARNTEINAFVIDIKDASGYVSHDSGVLLAREVGATGEIRIRDLSALLGRLAEEGVYPIARIVVTKDPLLAAGRPDLAIQDSAGGVWLDQDSVSWLNFHDREVWDYHVELALEAAAAGFPEIQWDYVRFPDAPENLLARAVFPGATGETRAQVVREFLQYAREALDRAGVLMTADVFGVTTSYRRDVGIGQL